MIDEMRGGADVIVVGGGIIGCAIARELAARGARVRLFEARTVAAGATRASAGILAPYIEGHERGPLFDLTLRSLALYDDFIARVRRASAVDIEYRRCGSLEIAADDVAADDFRRAAETAGDALQWLSAERRPETRARAPGLDPRRDSRARRMATSRSPRSPRPSSGPRFATAPSSKPVDTSGPFDVTATELEVTADDGAAWTARHVVVASGSWSGQLESARLRPRARCARFAAS